jgi:hypothetical protein
MMANTCALYEQKGSLMTFLNSLPTPFVTFKVESRFVPVLDGGLALVVNWFVPVDATYEQIDVIEADYKNFAQELVKQGWVLKLADYRHDNRGYVVIFELPHSREAIVKSAGHVEFIGDYEYFIHNDNLYHARKTNAIDVNGYRLGGRWIAPSHMIDFYLDLYRSLC